MKNYKEKLSIAALILVAVVILLWANVGRFHPGKRLETLKAVVLKIGKADAIVLQCGGDTVVIDAGEEEDGEEVVAYLKKQGVTRVDTLMITHFDKDHVGGADTVVEELEVGQVLLPDYEGNSVEYADFMRTLQESGITPLRVRESLELSLGDAKLMVDPPASFEIPEGILEYDNNLSLVTTVVHGGNRLVLAGDIEKTGIRQWLESGNAAPCDFIKMPHHGVYTKALEELLEATKPRYAVICTSSKNPAERKTLELLKTYNVQTMETKDGDVTVLSDGRMLQVQQRW